MTADTTQFSMGIDRIHTMTKREADNYSRYHHLTCHNFLEGPSNHEREGRRLGYDGELSPDHQEGDSSSKKNDQACHEEMAW